MPILPMFPLGLVLFPHMVLPLHVFEDRYRVMLRRVLDGDGEFGVVLIERGSEVGGGDQRASLGTVARVRDARELPDGRWLLTAVGIRRLRVVEWLPDDPHPRAEVEELADPPAGPEAAALRTEVGRELERVLALQAEAGDPAPPLPGALDPDPGIAAYQAAILAPLTPFDAQALLACDTPEERLQHLAAMLREAAELLRFRLTGT